MKRLMYPLLLCLPYFVTSCGGNQGNNAKNDDTSSEEDADDSEGEGKKSTSPSSSKPSGMGSSTKSESGPTSKDEGGKSEEGSDDSKSEEGGEDTSESSEDETKSETSSGEGETTSTEGDKPEQSEKEVEVIVPLKAADGEEAYPEIPAEGLRFRVDVDSHDEEDEDRIGSNLVDIEAKLEDGKFKVKIPAPDLEKDFGKEPYTFLHTALYVDKDGNKEFNRGDVAIAAANPVIIYAEPGKGYDEWMLGEKLPNGKFQPGPLLSELVTVRLDNSVESKGGKIGGTRSNIDKDVTGLATLSSDEAESFPDKFDSSARTLDGRFDTSGNSAFWEAEVGKAGGWPKARREDGLRSGFGEIGVGTIVGYSNSMPLLQSKLTPMSKIQSYGCSGAGSEMVTALYWINPENWIVNSHGASRVAVDGFVPGWNMIAYLYDEAQNGYALVKTLKGSEWLELKINKVCNDKLLPGTEKEGDDSGSGTGTGTGTDEGSGGTGTGTGSVIGLGRRLMPVID